MTLRDSRAAARAGTYTLGGCNVARMGYGAMQLERCAADPAEATALLEHAFDLGVNHVDTAQFYGDGFANVTIGNALRSRRDVVVASKIGADPNPGGRVPIKPAQRPEQLRLSVEDNLRSLSIDRIPVVNLRRLNVGPGLKADGDQLVDLDDQLAMMSTLRDEGKIGAIGLSAVDLHDLERALPVGIACIQNAYSLVSRQFEDVLALCIDRGIAWAPFFPLGGAFSGWPKVSEQPAVNRLALELGVTPSQLGLAWLLAHAPNMLLIPGTADRDHLDENVAAATINLPPSVMRELDGLELPPVSNPTF